MKRTQDSIDRAFLWPYCWKCLRMWFFWNFLFYAFHLTDLFHPARRSPDHWFECQRLPTMYGVGVSGTHALCWNDPVQYIAGCDKADFRSNRGRAWEGLHWCQHPFVHPEFTGVSVVIPVDFFFLLLKRGVLVVWKLKLVERAPSCQVVRNVRSRFIDGFFSLN